MAILSLADYRTLTNTVSGTDDAYITELLAVVQSQMESYCDRLFDAQNYSQWYKYSHYIVLREYPVNSVKFIGTLQKLATFSSDDYNYEVTSTALNITDGSLTTTTITFGGAISVLTDIKTAVEAAIPGLTLTIDTGYANISYKLLRVGTGKDMYGAVRSDCQTKLIEDENRTLELLADSSFLFFYATDFCTDINMYVVYNAGYTSTTMPLDLQMICANIVHDMSLIESADVTGIYKSETLGDYSYTLADQTQINELIFTKYSKALDAYVKMVV